MELVYVLYVMGASPERHANIALTSSRLTNGMVTAEIARQQPDSTWLRIIDQPAIAQETPQLG